MKGKLPSSRISRDKDGNPILNSPFTKPEDGLLHLIHKGVETITGNLETIEKKYGKTK